MASKRSKPVEDPPTASSSEEDGLETESGESEDSSSEEEDEVSSKNTSAVVALASATEEQVSDSESGSDEEESDSEPEKKDEVVTTKPPVTVKTSEESLAKRSRETDEAVSTDVKRVKKASGEEEKQSGGGEETKKTYFQRVWTEDDEIAVLQGLIDYKKDTGVSPYHDTNKVYQLVKKDISFDVSKVQFMEKLRSLKKKYENNLGKAKNGDEPTFVKPHDRKAFELSKFVWGAINGKARESALKSNGKSKSTTNNKGQVSVLGAVEFADSSSLVRTLARFGMNEVDAQQGLSRLASEDKKMFEEQWKALQVREFDFYSQKSRFLHDVITKMAEAFRSNA